jgi:hypothetical protein
MERSLEDLVWQRAGGRCEYCQISWDKLDLAFEFDHIIAEHHLGLTHASNLCLACFACNRHKGPNVAGVTRQRERSFRCSILAVTNGHGTFAGTVQCWLAGRRSVGPLPSR